MWNVRHGEGKEIEDNLADNLFEKYKKMEQKISQR